LDQAQKSDELIFGGEANPYRYVGAVVSEDGAYLFVSAAQATYGNELYFKDLRAKNAPILPIIQGLENETDVVHVEGDSVYLLTNLKAPNRRLVWTSLKSTDSRQWQDVISETEFPLSVSAVGGYFFASYLQDAVSKIVQYNQKGTMVRDIKLPGLGTASGFGGKRNEKICYYSFTSYTSPPVIYRLELSEGNSTVYKQSKVDFETDQYVSTQVFYESKDGTKVPMILTHRRDVVPNGENPVLLYGYGGFNISLSPSFSVSNLFFMEQGGIYAVANLRGGGEYGDRWHDAGTKMQKQNVFDDFISAAEWLINKGYTQSGRLAIAGGSNGGLLVGACMTQRPDLFKVCFPAVGVLDMLRYHTFTAGAGWAYDYGRSDDSEEMFQYLRGYSPVHNVKAKTPYPATMVTTADHDDRVVPAHSYKFIAELQSKQSGPSPVLIRIDVKAGHGAGKPTSMILDEAADKWSFMFYNIEFEPPFSR
jgi:prolyl oligopeptidase